MKVKVLVASLAATGAVAAYALTLNAAQPPAAPGYAEGIYADYARASGQQATFEIREIGSGPLTRLEGKSFAQIVGNPTYRVTASDSPLALREVQFKESIGQIDRHELDAGVEGFDEVGFPVSQGKYRILAVKPTVKGIARQHRAIEMCWENQGHCVVFDPNIEFLDSIVNNQRLAKAAGYAPTIKYEERAQLPEGQVGTQAVCALASDTRYIGKSLTWGAWTQRYKNIYGMTLVTKNLGGQQSGIRCDASCRPAPYGYSNSSNANGSLGYNATCGNLFNNGVSGGTGRWVAETKCTHAFVGSAKAEVTRSGVGSGVSLSWNTNGGIDSNGGYYTDTCAYF